MKAYKIYWIENADHSLHVAVRKQMKREWKILDDVNDVVKTWIDDVSENDDKKSHYIIT